MKTNPRLVANLPRPLKEFQLESRFDDHLDDVNPDIEALGITVTPSDFMKAHDETAYRCAFCDWVDSECRENNISEYDGSHYDKDDFDTAVADSISEVETELSDVETDINAAQDKLDGLELTDPASDDAARELSELTEKRDALNAEISELEDL